MLRKFLGPVLPAVKVVEHNLMRGELGRRIVATRHHANVEHVSSKIRHVWCARAANGDGRSESVVKDMSLKTKRGAKQSVLEERLLLGVRVVVEGGPITDNNDTRPILVLFAQRGQQLQDCLERQVARGVELDETLFVPEYVCLVALLRAFVVGARRVVCACAHRLHFLRRIGVAVEQG